MRIWMISHNRKRADWDSIFLITGTFHLIYLSNVSYQFSDKTPPPMLSYFLHTNDPYNLKDVSTNHP